MQYATLELSNPFKVLFSLRQVQAAEMVMAPGDREVARTIAIAAPTNGCSWWTARARPSWMATRRHCRPAA